MRDIFEKCLISLYGQPTKLLDKFERSGLTFAAPGFGIKVREGYFHIDDYAPFEELKSLLDKYLEFHLYIDDAHGMSWTGKNGAGIAI